MTPHFPVVNSNELEKVLKRLGFEVDHIKGSHVVYRRVADNKRVVVPRHAGDAIKRKTLSTILKSINMDPEEFKGHL
jgi:predicted RNA binding protein YcfA (HicA-like mRNA interferase family)